VYGAGTALDPELFPNEEAYVLKESRTNLFEGEDVEEHDDRFVGPTPKYYDKVRLSAMPVPNITRPSNMPKYYIGSYNGEPSQEDMLTSPDFDEFDDFDPKKNIDGLSMTEAIRKGSSIAAPRSNSTVSFNKLRSLPQLPGENSQGDILYVGMKQRFYSKTEEEGAMQLPQLVEANQQEDAIDAPPLPRKSPTDFNLAQSNGSVHASHFLSESNRIKDEEPADFFEPGSLQEQQFLKSQSNHPVAPVPPNMPQPSPDDDDFQKFSTPGSSHFI